MGKISSVFLIFTVFLVAELLVSCSGEDANATFGCILRERNALLRFKASLSDPSGRLSSWNATTDCCEWQGITCDETSGHVTRLDLQNQRYKYVDVDGDYYFSSTFMLHAETLDSSLLDFNMLSFLDLSGNDFHRSSIPSFLGSMGQIQHLNLSSANFSGVIPHQIGNLSLLSVLDLSYNELIVDDFTWVSHLSSLRNLSMSSVDLSPTNDLLKVLNMLPFLIDLRMSTSRLENRNLQHACVNSTLRHIEYLDLSQNNFHGSLPCFLENMTSLRYLLLSYNKYTSCDQNHLFKLTNLVRLSLGFNSLQCNADSISEFILDKPHLEYLSLTNNSCSGDVSKILLNLSRYPDPKLTLLSLGTNNFYGQLPEEIGRIRTLQGLYLYSNNISNSIPSSIGNLSALKYLVLSNNHLSGLIPSSIGNLRALEYLYLYGNLISGPIPTSIGNLSSLEVLSLYNNHLSGLIPSSLGNLSSLEVLSLYNNHLSGLIPSSLGNLSSLEWLYLSNNQLNGEIPVSFFDSLSKLRSLDLGRNSLKFVARRDWVPPFQLIQLLMGSCEIGGVFPQWIQTQKNLSYLSLPNCSISGEIPESLCEMKSLVSLSLAGNNLSGTLPECVGNLNMLQALALSSNRLSGVIPNSIGKAYSLVWLKLSENRFSGELPYNLRNCTQLEVLDIGENEISGKVPKWMGNSLINLRVLRLRSNELYDTIPSNLCQLSELQVLDLAINNFTGNIPHCIHNFTRLVFKNSSIDPLWYGLKLMIKGLELDYSSNLRYVVYMDLSSNNLVGEIPLELTSLTALHFLNLSHNHLQGHIPRQIGDMNSLESLDLSNNNLSGNIPQGLSKLTSMSYLNLSHNKLTGEIPTGNQLQTLVDPSIYEGNPGLCGAPLPKTCHEEKASPNLDNPDVEGEEDKTERIWFYGIVISGFATGFWGAIGVLVFKIRWRHVYFRFTDEIIARIFGA